MTTRSKSRASSAATYNVAPLKTAVSSRRGATISTAQRQGGCSERQHRAVAAVVPRLQAQSRSTRLHESPHFPTGPLSRRRPAVYPRNGGVTHAPERRCGRATAWDRTTTRPASIPARFQQAVAIPPHPLYQPHYDRDFSSVGELFNIPLYGQMQAPQWVPSANVYGRIHDRTLLRRHGLPASVD